MNENTDKLPDGVRFNEEEIRFIRQENQRQNEIYFHSITQALKDLRVGISEDVADVIRPINERFFGITDDLRHDVNKLEKIMIGMAVVTVSIIIVVIILHV